MWNKIKYSSIWLQPLCMAFLIIVTRDIPQITHQTVLRFGLSFIISWLPTLYCWLWHRRERLGGKTEFGLLDAFSNQPDPNYGMASKRKAMYPEVSMDLLFDKPTGVVFGSHKGKYVCKTFKRAKGEHAILIGGSGSGKTSTTVLCSLLVLQSDFKEDEDVCVWAVDIKGELSQISARLSDPKVIIFDPSDRTTWGYDPFYRLKSGESSQQDILETMQDVTNSLISSSADIKDPFWIESSRSMLTGLLVYYYSHGKHNFIDIVDSILDDPIDEIIKKICVPSERGTVAYRYLIQFSTMPADTLGGVYGQMVLPLRKFSGDMNIRFAFRENPRKLNPRMLIDGKSVFVRIKEERIADYACILKLVLNQQIRELEEKTNNRKIYMIIDELARILSGSSSGGGGRLERLLDGSRTMRSRGACLILITQSCEGLMCSYTENEVMDLISNCSYIAVLNATSSKTQKMIVEWCGKYNARKKTWDGSGSNRKSTISFEEKDIVSAEDLMTLPTSKEGELLLISPYGYNRLKKVSYYDDKYITPIADQISKENQKINEVIKKEG